MAFRQALRRWLRQRRFVQRALEAPPEPVFERRRSTRIVVGLVLLVASYLICWPAITALAAVAAWLGRPKLLLGGPALYGLSWLLFIVALALLGSKSVSGGRALVRKLAERFLRE